MKFLLRLLLVLTTLLGMWPAAAASPPVTPEAPAALDKVSPWVRSAVESDETADVLLVLADQADLSAAESLPTKQARGRYVYTTLWEHAQRSQASLKGWLEVRGIPYQSFYIVNLVLVPDASQSLVEDLARRPDVARIDANPAIYNDVVENPIESLARELDTVQENLVVVGAPDVWALGYTGQGIVVGGQDTGYEWDHPALINQYRGWDGETADHDYNWHDAIHENDPNTADGNPCGFDSSVPCDDHSHGTHTMGIVLGDDGDTNQIGMAPDAQWIGCRNMEQGWGTPATYIECFEFFLAPYPVGGDPAEGNPDLAPDVTNNSWGCPVREGCVPDTLQAAVAVQRAAGIMTVTSAGNDGNAIEPCGTVSSPPAIYDDAYTIGNVNNYDVLASSSSRGPVTVDSSGRIKPDLVAPGTSIYSSILNGGYGIKSGTSMASPHVAGAVALLWSADPLLIGQVTQTEELLNATAAPIPVADACGSSGVPNNYYGWGRLNALAAVQQAPGIVNGTVRNELGDPVDAATVSSEGVETLSRPDGSYDLWLESGTYTVTATATGYMPALVSGVEVTTNLTTTLEITLTFPPYDTHLPLILAEGLP